MLLLLCNSSRFVCRKAITIGRVWSLRCISRICWNCPVLLYRLRGWMMPLWNPSLSSHGCNRNVGGHCRNCHRMLPFGRCLRLRCSSRSPGRKGLSGGWTVSWMIGSRLSKRTLSRPSDLKLWSCRHGMRTLKQYSFLHCKVYLTYWTSGYQLWFCHQPIRRQFNCVSP